MQFCRKVFSFFGLLIPSSDRAIDIIDLFKDLLLGDDPYERVKLRRFSTLPPMKARGVSFRTTGRGFDVSLPIFQMY